MSLKASVLASLLAAMDLRAKSAVFGSSTIGDIVLFEDENNGDFLRLYETKKVNDPDNPEDFGGVYSERWFNTNLCGFNDVVSLRGHEIVQDITNRKNLIFAIGVRSEDINDPVSGLSDFGTGLGCFDIYDDGGATDQGSVALTVRSDTVISGFKDENDDDSRLTLNDPDGNTVIILEDGVATVNDFDISLKEHTDVPGVGKYTIERDPNGNILEIKQYVYNLDPVSGVQTVTLPLVLPDDDEAKVNIQITGSTAAGFAVGNYVQGTLTTTSLNMVITDGVGFTDDDSYVELTWKP